MPKLPHLSGEEIVKALEKLGFRFARQRGSHVVLKKVLVDGERGCVVPLHREVAVGTLSGILRQAGISADEFIAHL